MPSSPPARPRELKELPKGYRAKRVFDFSKGPWFWFVNLAGIPLALLVGWLILLLAAALRGLAHARAPEARERLREIAAGRMRIPGADRLMLRREARQSLALMEVLEHREGNVGVPDDRYRERQVAFFVCAG